MNPGIRKMLEDRLAIKSTQKLKRHIQPREIAQFFTNNKYKLDTIETKFIKDLDKLLNDFLEKKL